MGGVGMHRSGTGMHLGGHRSDVEMHWDELGCSGVALRWLEHIRVTKEWTGEH